jgi:hypothetical protein
MIKKILIFLVDIKHHNIYYNWNLHTVKELWHILISVN